MIKKKIFTVLCILLLGVKAFSQKTEDDIIFRPELVLEYDSEKNYLVAFGGMLLSNSLIFSFNKYVDKASYANVTWSDIKEHITVRGEEFDHDWYWTNFVLHPYQGSLSYLAARNCNLSWWEGMLLANIGSILWEYAGETDWPSINDIIYTPVGAVALGEMFYRLSLEAQSYGLTWLSIFANPQRLYTDFALKRRPQGYTGRIYSVSTKIGFGTASAVTWLGSKKRPEFFPAMMQFELDAIYSDPYGHESDSPYSQFELEFGLASGIGSGYDVDDFDGLLHFDIHIFSNGVMYSKAVDFGEDKDTTIGIILEYDFMWHSFMEFSDLAPGIAIKQRIKRENYNFEWQSHLDVMILGTSDFYHLTRGIVKPDRLYRDYGFCWGFEAVEKAVWKFNNGLTLNGTVHGYMVYKPEFQKQKCDDSGWDFFTFIDLSVEYNLSKRLAIGISDEIFLKQTNYKNFTDYFSVLNTFNVYGRYKPFKR